MNEFEYPKGRVLCDQIAAISPSVFLAFSCGKDSIAAWIKMKEYGSFEKIIPYYCYIVPGLEFVDESLAWYERFFGCKIYQLPHPTTFEKINSFVFQPPERCRYIEAAGLPDTSYSEIEEALAEDLGFSKKPYKANGVRESDSIQRRLSVRKNGPINHDTKTFLPIWDMGQLEVLEVIRRAGCKLPKDYPIFGRSFDGINYQYLAPMKKHFPRDYARVLEVFPLAELEIFRYERMEK